MPDDYHRRYYADNKDRLLDRRAERYATPQGRARTLFNNAQRAAAKRAIDFTLTFERVHYALIVGRCERTGINFDLTAMRDIWRNPWAPSIDRIDNFGGYTNDNVQIVVNLYNTGKGQHTDAEFIEFCHRVAERNPRK